MLKDFRWSAHVKWPWLWLRSAYLVNVPESKVRYIMAWLWFVVSWDVTDKIREFSGEQ